MKYIYVATCTTQHNSQFGLILTGIVHFIIIKVWAYYFPPYAHKISRGIRLYTDASGGANRMVSWVCLSSSSISSMNTFTVGTNGMRFSPHVTDPANHKPYSSVSQMGELYLHFSRM